MKTISSVIRVPEVMHTMRDLSKEMAKAGIIEEMVGDAMDSVMDDDTIEV